MKKIIPYGLHKLDRDDIDSVIEILASGGSITQGQEVEKFGRAIADYSGAKYGVAVSNGTAALHLSVAALGIGEGDEILTTPITFCATANAALYQGADVKFVDVDQNTINLDISLIEEKITEKTKAIMPVDFRGHPANLPEIKNLADKYNIAVIEDGSHSIGSNYIYNGKEHSCGDGVHADLCTFSFHPVKHITTGEGGAIVTNNKDLFNKINLLRKHGIDRRTEMFNQADRVGPWIYEMEYLGFNYRITDFQAALGISQLKKIDENKTRRRNIVEFYNEKLLSIDELILPFEDENVDSNFHLYVLQVKNNPRFDRYDLFEKLQNLHYAPMVHYIPVHLLKYYKKRYGTKRGDFPNAEEFYDRAISIPLYPSLTDSEVEQVVSDIVNIVKSY